MTRLVIVACSVIALAGSVGCYTGPWGKRSQELSCPTDVRKMHPWCWGEDAVFDCPCGPDESYHGHKPTCWRDWQAPAAVWRDERCGCPTSDYGSAQPSTAYGGGVPVEAVPPATAADPSDEVGAEEDSLEHVLPLSPEGSGEGEGEDEMLPEDSLDSAYREYPARPLASWLPTLPTPSEQVRRMPLVNEPGQWGQDLGGPLPGTATPAAPGAEGSFGFRIVN